MSEPDISVQQLLNAQTGRIGWEELQRHFARGVVLIVATSLDLVEVAAAVVSDDSEQLRAWLDADVVSKASLEHARDWEKRKPEFWAVVAAPWVLVQECS